MSANPVLIELLERNLGQVKMTLADFSEAELFVRPVPAANHVAWALGHLAASEMRMMKLIKPDLESPLPAGYVERFAKEQSHGDDPALFAGKEALLSNFEACRAITLEMAKSASAEEMARAIPSPFRPGTQTTVGFMLHMPAMHTTMHLGQWQVIRRHLGKPVLF